MEEFKKVKANEKSMSRRLLVYGVGINDADYKISYTVGHINKACPVYGRWRSMIERCYGAKSKQRNLCYIGCSVCDEWLVFSVFSKWFCENNVNGYHLDKDIKVKGNKIYGPDTCLMVPRCINNLLCSNSKGRGVSANRNKFSCQISIDNNLTYLGNFDTKQEAIAAYVSAKNAEINRKCTQYPEFARYLIKHIITE